MKKVSRILAVALAIILVSGVAVLAAPTTSITSVTESPKQGDTVTVVAKIADGAALNGKQVTMLAYLGSEPSESNIIGVDQYTSDGSGNVTFTFGTDANTPTGTYTLKVGGEDVDTAATSSFTLGSVASVGHNVSGTVAPVAYFEGYEDLNTAFAVTLNLKTSFLGNTVATTTADKQTGAFEFTNIADGSYVLEITKAGYLSRYTNVVVSGGNVIDINKQLIGGDFNADFSVDAVDAGLLFEKLGLAYGDAGFDTNIDISNDASVDAVDAGLLFENLGKDVSAYGEDVNFDQ